MKTKIVTLICILLILIAFINLQSGDNEVVSVSTILEYVKNRDNFTLVEEIPDELLNGEYGESAHWQEINGIKASLATVNTEKHFISYSWASYDLSNFTVKLYIEDMSGADLNKNVSVNGMVKSGDLVTTSFYAEVEDFPADDPLGYKHIVILYFYPLEGNPDMIDLTLYYGDQVFILQDVNIVI